MPVADDVFRDHLQGRIVSGVYPLLRDDTCWFVAIDLDGESWREDAIALRAAAAPSTCRSRSSGALRAAEEPPIGSAISRPQRLRVAPRSRFGCLPEARRKTASRLASASPATAVQGEAIGRKRALTCGSSHGTFRLFLARARDLSAVG
jgi:hypothetical protein